MAEYLIQGETLTEIADAIRAKLGINATILTSNMATTIGAIPTGNSDSDSGSDNDVQIKINTLDVQMDTNTLAFACSFTPSYLFLWTTVGDGSTFTDDVVTAFIYDSSETTGEAFHYYVYDADASSIICQVGGINDPSTDDPRFWVKKSSGMIVVGISSSVGDKFLKGTWKYIAIA